MQFYGSMYLYNFIKKNFLGSRFYKLLYNFFFLSLFLLFYLSLSRWLLIFIIFYGLPCKNTRGIYFLISYLQSFMN